MVHEDLDDLCDLRMDPIVSQYLQRDVPTSRKEVVDFIIKIRSGLREHKWIYWAIRSKDHFRANKQPSLIGTICLWQINVDKKSCDIGFELALKYQGKGIMSKAVKIVCEYGLTEMNLYSIVGYARVNNAPSIKLMKRSGFKFIGNDHENGFDHVIYAIESPIEIPSNGS